MNFSNEKMEAAWNFFNKFYNAHSVLNLDDEILKNTRLKLVEASTIVIKNGLYLLGIDVVEKM